MKLRFLKKTTFGLLMVVAGTLVLSGCEGDDGPPGPPGLNAGQGTINLATLDAQQQADITYQGEVTGVTVSSPPVVKFRIRDANGNPITGLGVKDTSTPPRLNNLKFTIAKLVPGVNGSPSRWVNYIVTSSAATPAGQRPGQDREGTLVDNGDGSYQYTFYRDITKAKDTVAALADSGNNRKSDLGDLTFDPNLTHRLIIEYGGNIINTSPGIPIANPLNIVYDFIPATGRVVTASNTQREIVTTANCNECHGMIGVTTPHTGRIDTRYCVVCHTSQRAFGRPLSTSTATTFNNITTSAFPAGSTTYIADGEVLGDFTTMVHKIHMGNRLSKDNYNYAGVMFDELGYPQDPGVCRKCHNGAEAAQGENWNTRPSRQACGSCHDNVNFATGAGHSAANFPQQDDSACNVCHTADAIKLNHAQNNKSANNPDTPAGLVNFTYQIDSATVAGNNDLSIKFRILGDGTPVTFVAPAATVTAPLAGFTGSPSFVLAWARPQGAITEPVDYNNIGTTATIASGGASQPPTVSIATLLGTNNAAIGSISGPDSSGYYTATIKSASAFPAGARMRAVALQGVMTQLTTPTTTQRPAVSVIRPVTGDAVRRVVVDPVKCSNCHELLVFHGGNRVFETQVCVTCHNPNLTNSGRTITDAKLSGFNFSAVQRELLLAWDPGFNQTTPGYSLTFAETSNNFKEMIHGLHAGSTRTNPFRDVRNGPSTNITLLDAGPFVFPNILSNCFACHVTPQAGTNRQTWKANLPVNVLPTTMVTRNAAGEATIADKTAARGTVPNPEDLVVGPLTGACISCHDSAVAKAHMVTNGAQLGAAANGPSYTNMGVARASLSAEQCVLCHGEGRIADVVTVHSR